MSPSFPQRLCTGALLFILAVPVATASGVFADPARAKTFYQPDRRVLMDQEAFSKILLDKLEWQGTDPEGTLAWEGEAWAGTDFSKFWFKTEGSRVGGRTEDAEIQALFDRPFSRFFDWQAGVRHDFELGGPGRDWLAFGVEGLAPYYFEVQATAFAGEHGRTAARFKASYEWLFTQRLILSPELELNAYGKDDPARSIGSGLSDSALGLRLRYELRREFAPYVGVEMQRQYGGTADFTRAAGDDPSQTVWVAGLRIWL